MSDKHDLEFNKLAAGVLFAGVLAMLCTFIADALYHPKTPDKPVFAIDVPEVAEGGAATAEPEVPIAELMATADAARGEALVGKKCAACHTFDAGGPNKVGPNLHGLFGHGVGADKGGYAFSTALKEHGGTWDYETLNHWLQNPQSFAKGAKMVLKTPKPAERADIIKYLESIK